MIVIFFDMFLNSILNYVDLNFIFKIIFFKLFIIFLFKYSKWQSIDGIFQKKGVIN